MSASNIDWSGIILDNLFRLYRATAGNNNVEHIVNDGYEIVYSLASHWPNMVFNISKSNFDVALVEDIGDQIIDSSFESLSEWVKLVELNLFDNKHLEQSVFKALIGEKKLSVVYARLNGNLVGTAMIFYDNYQFAGVYMVSTNLEFRCRGIGRRIMEFCFSDIKAKGISFCVLQSTSDGLPMYEKLRFKSDGKLNLYWKVK